MSRHLLPYHEIHANATQVTYLCYFIYIYINTHTIAIFLAAISCSCGNTTSNLKKLSKVKTQPAEQVTFKYSAIEEY